MLQYWAHHIGFHCVWCAGTLWAQSFNSFITHWWRQVLQESSEERKGETRDSKLLAVTYLFLYRRGSVQHFAQLPLFEKALYKWSPAEPSWDHIILMRCWKWKHMEPLAWPDIEQSHILKQDCHPLFAEALGWPVRFTIWPQRRKKQKKTTSPDENTLECQLGETR